MRPNPLALLTLIAAATVSGCMTFSAAPLAPDWSASQLAVPQGFAGLAVGVRTLDGLAEENAVIGRPARDRGLAPFVLLLENRGDFAFRLRSSGIRLETRDGRSFTAAALPEVHDRLRFSQASALWGLPFGILPAFFLGNRVSEQNEELLADLEHKLFRDCVIDRNEGVRNSLVFFDVGPAAASQLAAADCRVIVEVEREPSAGQPGEWLRFQLTPASSLRE